MCDLLCYLIGDASDIKIINKGRTISEFDYEPDFCIRFKDADIYFLAARNECFSINCMELMCTKGHISYAENGHEISFRKSCSHPVYPGYTVLSEDNQAICSDLKRYQWYVLENLKLHLIDDIALKSNGASATAVLDLVENVFSLL